MTHHIVPRRVSLIVAASLMALLGITALLARIDLGPWNIVAAMAIALAKAGLVVTFFMELKDRSPLMRLVAGVGGFWLAILLTLTLTDVLSR